MYSQMQNERGKEEKLSIDTCTKQILDLLLQMIHNPPASWSRFVCSMNAKKEMQASTDFHSSETKHER